MMKEQEKPKTSKTGISQEKRRKQRRTILGAITAAGAVGTTKLPNQWQKPVVDHVLLPAHADTTFDCVITCAGTLDRTLGVFSSTSNDASIFFVTALNAATVTCTRDPGGETASTIGAFTNAFTTAATDTNTVPTSITEFIVAGISGTLSDQCTTPLTDGITNLNVSAFFYGTS